MTTTDASRVAGIGAHPRALRAETACAQEAIQTPGTVQPHGALLVLDPSQDLLVVAGSHNIAEFLPAEIYGNGVLGRSVETVLGAAFTESLRERLASGELRCEAPWLSTKGLAGVCSLDIAVHAHAGLVIVEVEEFHVRDEALALIATRQLQEVMADLRSARGELSELARVVTRGVRLLTGYERVIVYRFDADWNGQAIAEDKIADWQQSLDGLHFPASDIPAQARALYQRSHIRWVPDRDATPISVELFQAETDDWPPPNAIDMSFARLRSLSPIHLQYHRNMGVNGSMSISILHNDQLWGLIVCHHRNAHGPSSGQRAAAAALTDAFALRIGPAEHADAVYARGKDRETLAALLVQIAETQHVVGALTTGDVTVANLFGATGAALLYEGKVTLLGNAPAEASVIALRTWLQSQEGAARLFSTANLSRQFAAWASHASEASGVLAVFLDADHVDMLVWFRQEEPQQVSWGGNPHKTNESEMILPRESFERWVEVRHGAALPWQPWELELAETLRHAITDVIVRTLRHIADLNEQLRQSQKMEAVGQLTGGIAHDFNNLLTGIIGSIELLGARVAEGRTAELARYIGMALTSANRAAALTHRLLAFSRRQALDPRPLDVNRIAASLDDLIRRAVGPSIHVETIMAGGLWRTLCDPNQLENALLNLALNARDAMPDGGKLTIEAGNAWLDDAYAHQHLGVSAGQYVAVSVTDTGTGMAPDVVARVFEPFFTTKPLGQGTGLGLSMVYGFAQQSHGHARVYSEVGAGTTVRLYLPRYTGNEQVESANSRPFTKSNSDGETILLVDDEPIVRALVSELLNGFGYRVLEAETGSQALSILQTGAVVDLLVTDFGLPGGMNGRQLVDQAREGRPALKALFVTGYAENSVLTNGILAPGMQMLTKPFSMEALSSKVQSMLR